MFRIFIFHVFYLKAKISLWKKVRFRGFTVVYSFKNSHIYWGERITINSAFLSNLVDMHQRAILIARYGGIIRIGNGVEMSGMTIYALRHSGIARIER